METGRGGVCDEKNLGESKKIAESNQKPYAKRFKCGILQSEKGITLAETHFNDLGEPKQFTTMLVYFDWDN